MLAALAASQRRFHSILLRRGIHAESVADIVELAEQRHVPVRFVEEGELAAHAHGATHGGVIALCGPKPRLDAGELDALLDRTAGPPLLLLLEGVDDARNLGFTIRTAEAMGVTAMLIKRHVWDFDAAEVARPASGAYERLPLVQLADAGALVRLGARGIRRIACLANAKRTIHEFDLTRPTLLVIGGEKRGVSGAVRSVCDAFATIPTVGGASSLPLSHAAAIVCAEALRQRRAAAVAQSPQSETHASIASGAENCEAGDENCG